MKNTKFKIDGNKNVKDETQLELASLPFQQHCDIQVDIIISF